MTDQPVIAHAPGVIQPAPVTDEGAEGLIHWKCQKDGRHIWVWPDISSGARIPTGTKICLRRYNWRGKVMCQATKSDVTPSVQEPDVWISAFLTPHGARMARAGEPLGWWDILLFSEKQQTLMKVRHVKGQKVLTREPWDWGHAKEADCEGG